MQRRKIIRIDEDRCDGCGECITACSEGALRLVDGKARLVKEAFCDGFGDCVGECPTGALVVEEREAEAFDFDATRVHVERLGGSGALRRFDRAAAAHDALAHGAARGPLNEAVRDAAPGPGVSRPHVVAPGAPGLPMAGPAPAGGCPGTRIQFRPTGGDGQPVDGDGPKQAIPSELRQWPAQLHLVQPGAPFFENRELVIMNTCGPIASADVHWRFLRGRSVVVGCPKLDDTRPYAEKLAAIFRESAIPKAIVVRMEVPCCGGLTAIAREARSLSGREDLVLEEVTLAVNGDLLAKTTL